MIEYYEALSKLRTEIDLGESEEKKKNLAKEYECFQMYYEDDYEDR